MLPISVHYIGFVLQEYSRSLGFTPRTGSEIDAENLRQTAYKLGFEYVRIFKNKRKSEIIYFLSQGIVSLFNLLYHHALI